MSGRRDGGMFAGIAANLANGAIFDCTWLFAQTTVLQTDSWERWETLQALCWWALFEVQCCIDDAKRETAAGSGVGRH